VVSESRPADEIVTADVSELVDSSNEILIQRLNERARMFNPAWLLYVAAAGMVIAAVAMFSAASDNALPDVSALMSADRDFNVVDEYSMLVERYGYPDSVLSRELMGSVTVRATRYTSAKVEVAFVQNGCVGAYEEVARTLADKTLYPALAKHEATKLRQCIPSPNPGWKIVAYTDSAEKSSISADIAKIRLDGNGIGVKRAAAPVVAAEAPAGKQTAAPRILAKKQLLTKRKAESKEQTWVADEQNMRRVEAADREARYSSFIRWALLLGGVGLFGTAVVVHKRNTEKRTTRLFYELSETEEQKYGIVQQAVSHLGRCHRTWRVEGSSATSDWKRNAGTSTIVRRVPITVGPSNPPRVKTNLAIPSINTGPASLFFPPRCDFVFGAWRVWWDRVRRFPRRTKPHDIQ